jgi:hypothetical protein
LHYFVGKSIVKFFDFGRFMKIFESARCMFVCRYEWGLRVSEDL